MNVIVWQSATLNDLVVAYQFVYNYVDAIKSRRRSKTPITLRLCDDENSAKFVGFLLVNFSTIKIEASQYWRVYFFIAD